MYIYIYIYTYQGWSVPCLRSVPRTKPFHENVSRSIKNVPQRSVPFRSRLVQQSQPAPNPARPELASESMTSCFAMDCVRIGPIRSVLGRSVTRINLLRSDPFCSVCKSAPFQELCSIPGNLFHDRSVPFLVYPRSIYNRCYSIVCKYNVSQYIHIC